MQLYIYSLYYASSDYVLLYLIKKIWRVVHNISTINERRVDHHVFTINKKDKEDNLSVVFLRREYSKSSESTASS